MTKKTTNRKKYLTPFQDIFHLLVLKWTGQVTVVPLIKLVEGVKIH